MKFRLLLGALALGLTPVTAIAQSAVISGRITAEDRGALSDVAVSIPELGVGTVTRDDGRFTINVPGARVTGQPVTLTARRIGYRSQPVRITLSPGTITHDNALPADPLHLSELAATDARTTNTGERL